MAKLIAFRVDASLQIGSGHVMRCLTLADALTRQGVQCHFISRAHPGHLLDVIRQRGFAFTTLTEEAPPPSANMQHLGEHLKEPAHAHWLCCDWQTDAEETRVILEKLQPDWLGGDHYALDQCWEVSLQPYCQTIMVIDDLADRPHQCDLLLDQNLGRQSNDYANLVPTHCKVLAGPQYALLRPEFAALRSYSLQRRQQPVFKQMLITMGGVDQPNATGQVLQSLKSCTLPQDCRISVVMGAEAPWLQQVRAQAQDMPWPTEVLVNISNMARRMADSDLAIGAAGSTSWERCCLGLPTLMVVLADNQRAIAEVLQAAGAAKILDNAFAVPMTCEVLSSFVTNTNALYEMSIEAARIVDGLGTASVVSIFLALENL